MRVLSSTPGAGHEVYDNAFTLVPWIYSHSIVTQAQVVDVDRVVPEGMSQMSRRLEVG
jgi:hypothetical protein